VEFATSIVDLQLQIDAALNFFFNFNRPLASLFTKSTDEIHRFPSAQADERGQDICRVPGSDLNLTSKEQAQVDLLPSARALAVRLRATRLAFPASSSTPSSYK